MPRIMIGMKLTEAERALLRKRAKRNGVTEADYLRLVMVMEAVTAGDLDGVRILGEGLRRKLVQVLHPGDRFRLAVHETDLQDAPVRA